jgi:hypothetical protein
MPIRHYAWMDTHAATRSYLKRAAATGGSETPVSAAADTEAQAGGKVSTTPVFETESAATEASPPTAQEASGGIAANEVPALPAELAAPAPASDSPQSTKIVAMAPLRGSLESLIRQNEKTNADNLERIEDEADLEARIASGQLVKVPESAGLTVNPELPVNRRYCRPWTAAFLTDLAHAHEAQFHRPFEVSSAVRTVQYQKHLVRTNGNAAPAEGDIASPHLTGAAVDISKRDLSRSEIYWMRDRLNSLEAEGKIDVEEEFRQSCFHITVYKSYTGDGPVHKPASHDLARPTDGPDAPTPPLSEGVAPGV